MSQHDDSEPASFRGLTLEEQISKCHMLAAEAERAAVVNPGERDKYLDLAAKWSDLAEEMQNAQDSRTLQT